MTDKEKSYIDYEAFLSPSFSPSAFANSIVLGTNNPTDASLDLSTPLSKVLFDTQEINTSIDTLASNYALPLLTHTQEQTSSSIRIAQVIDSQISSLNDSYERLEREVLVRYKTAEEIKHVSQRLWETAKLGRSVLRCLQWGRQLEIQLAEISGTGNPTQKQVQKEDHAALVRCSNTLICIHDILSRNEDGQEGYRLGRVDVIKTLLSSIVNPTEKIVLSKSQQIVREFSVASPSTTFTQVSEVRAKLTSALTSLYVLSLASSAQPNEKWEPEYLVNALQDYLRAALNSSLTTLSRALGALPTLDRTLLEISVRCQNIIILESILSETIPPSNTIIISRDSPPQNFLQPLLTRLETNSLPSWFWRTLASGLSSKMTELVNRGGVSLRTLRNNKNSVKDAVRECVVRGAQLPGKSDLLMEGKWEREIAVMIASISGPLGKGG